MKTYICSHGRRGDILLFVYYNFSISVLLVESYFTWGESPMLRDTILEVSYI